MENGLKEEKFEIRGMHCNSCVNSIESKVGSLEGVENIKVNLIENKAFVRFDPNKISLENIKSEINSLGYSTGNKVADKTMNKNILQGIAYGLIPHIGCIAFIIGSVLGVTMLMNFFKPLLMNPYFFHILILISLLFATFSSILYLRKNSLLSLAGAKRKWKYFMVMYGSTIGINLLLFMVIFPLFANISIAPSITGAVIGTAGSNNDYSLLKLSVDIPCPGHAPLISQELKSIDGFREVKFSFPNVFEVTYDSTKASEQEILSLEVFKTYKATVLENSVQQTTQQINQQPATPPATGGSCCSGGGSCGEATGGGCGCGGYRG